VAVTSTATECRVATTHLEAGKHTFEVENKGDAVTEVYVYGPGDKVITEKENIGPGTRARFQATLAAGTYEVACKPGQRGSGIRQAITVS
jgi:iron uptake system component EfeO